MSSPATSARVRPAPLEEVPHRGALVRADRREHLEHLAAEARDEPSSRARLRERFQLEHGRALVGAMPEVERHRQSLQLDLAQRATAAADAKSAICCRQRSACRVELEPVRADVDDALDRDPLAHVVARAPADDGDEPVARHESL